jgi:Arm DNA-binding domain
VATIESYQTAAGKRYQVRYRTPQQTQTKKRGFKTKRDAQEFAATVEVEKMTGTYVAPKLGMITVSELAPAWLSRKESDVAPSNYRTLETAWRIHVKPVWGTTRVADVDLAAVERWIATMGKASGATVVIRAYGVLAGILDDAVKSRRLATNPSRGVENLPNKTSKRRVYLTVDDVARLAAESGQHRALVLTPGSDGAKRSPFVCVMSSSCGGD